MREFWRIFSKSKAGVIGLAIVVFWVIVALFAPLISPYDPLDIEFQRRYEAPSWEHPMGCDHLGRDLLSRIIYGSRNSLIIGIGVAGIVAFIGSILGSVSGFYGGLVDSIVTRSVDIVWCIPTFFFILTIMTIFGSGLWQIIFVMSATLWPPIARLVRAETLSVREKPFVEAAKMSGMSNFRIIFSEIFPNTVSPVIVSATLQVGSAILYESALSFLGLGDPTMISWGWLVHDALRALRIAWWVALFPGLAISLLVIGINVFGDGLNDALNPRLRER